MNMDRSPSDPRAGLMLVELLITLVILGLVGAAITGLFLTQSRVFGQQTAMREARTISQGALNVMLTELRMVDAVGGVVAAGDQAVTIRVPYTLGMICSANSTLITVSLFPTDNAEVGGGWSLLAGYAWRDADGTYTYRGASLSSGTGAATACANAGIAVVPGGIALRLTPGDAAAQSGAPIMLYRRITYDFRPTPSSPGNVDLWRKVEGVNTDEIAIGGPFDAQSSGFRYYLLNKSEPEENTPANPHDIRGLELVLNGRSGRPAAGGLESQTAQFATAVFFHNR